MKKIIGNLLLILAALILGTLSGIFSYVAGKGLVKAAITGVAVGVFVLIFFNIINID